MVTYYNIGCIKTEEGFQTDASEKAVSINQISDLRAPANKRATSKFQFEFPSESFLQYTDLKLAGLKLKRTSKRLVDQLEFLDVKIFIMEIMFKAENK